MQGLWDRLSLELRSQLELTSLRLEMKRGQSIYQAGELPKGLYLVQEGLVGLVLIGASSGKEHLIRFFTRGQFFGHRSLFSNEPYHGTTTALEPTRLLLFPKSAVERIFDGQPLVYREIVKVLSAELKQAEHLHVMVLENQILPRTAQALVYLKELQPDHDWTRQEIANFCGSTVSTVIKAMGELEEMGLIRQDGRHFQILDRSKLIGLQETV